MGQGEPTSKCLNMLRCYSKCYEYRVVYDKVFIKKIERFNKPKTDVEAEHTNIRYISFPKLFTKPKTCERVVDVCSAYTRVVN